MGIVQMVTYFNSSLLFCRYSANGVSRRDVGSDSSQLCSVAVTGYFFLGIESPQIP